MIVGWSTLRRLVKSGLLDWGVTNNLKQRQVYAQKAAELFWYLVFAKYVKLALDEVFVVNVKQFSGFSDH